jgi:hypothetical protein
MVDSRRETGERGVQGNRREMISSLVTDEIYGLVRMRSSLARTRSSLVRMKSSLVRMRFSLVRMRSSLVYG